MSQNVVSVSTLVHYLKSKLESDNLIQKVLVEGEISNFSNYRSGHWYFSLKDENSLIRCVMFSSYNKKVQFAPKDGDKVIIQADVSVYEQRGDIQLLVYAMKSDKIGDLYLQFEQLKAKLYAEGLFNDKYKKPIPLYPMNIALVTGANTAARSDVLTTLNRRWPIAEIHEYSALVQGNESAGQIINALKQADNNHHDVILLVRGGGSIEDLWSFNDETLARTIFNLKTPIITGIGHEINYTISDYVADLRAPTPTGAAERCAPDQKDVLNMLNVYQTRLNTAITSKKDHASRELNKYSSSFVFSSPQRLYSEKEMQLVNLSNALYHSVHTYEMNLEQSLSRYANLLTSTIKDNLSQLNLDINKYKNKLNNSVKFIKDKKENSLKQNAGLLDAYSPLKSLARGYAIVEKDGEAIKSTDNLHTDDTLSIQMYDGKIITKVAEIIKEKQHG